MGSVLILLIFFFLIIFTKLPILFFILLFYFGNSKSEIIIKCNIAYSFHKKYKYCIACHFHFKNRFFFIDDTYLI